MRSLFVLLFATSLLAQKQAELGKGLNTYSLEKELAIGKELLDKFTNSLPPSSDRSQQARIESIGGRLLADPVARADTFAYRFVIFDDKRTDFSVFASGLTFPGYKIVPPLSEPVTLPGGGILVPENLIGLAADEAQVAALLAHAIAHVAGRHATRMASRAKVAGMTQSRMEPFQWTEPSAQQLPVGFLQFARSSELDADKWAVRFLKNAGYDPAALIAFIGKLPEPPGAAVFQAAPSPQKRIEALKREIANRPD